MIFKKTEPPKPDFHEVTALNIQFSLISKAGKRSQRTVAFRAPPGIIFDKKRYHGTVLEQLIEKHPGWLPEKAKQEHAIIRNEEYVKCDDGMIKQEDLVSVHWNAWNIDVAKSRKIGK